MYLLYICVVMAHAFIVCDCWMMLKLRNILWIFSLCLNSFHICICKYLHRNIFDSLIGWRRKNFWFAGKYNQHVCVFFSSQFEFCIPRRSQQITEKFNRITKVNCESDNYQFIIITQIRRIQMRTVCWVYVCVTRYLVVRFKRLRVFGLSYWWSTFCDRLLLVCLLCR